MEQDFNRIARDIDNDSVYRNANIVDVGANVTCHLDGVILMFKAVIVSLIKIFFFRSEALVGRDQVHYHVGVVLLQFLDRDLGHLGDLPLVLDIHVGLVRQVLLNLGDHWR